MPLLLYRYILGDLLRVVLLSAAVLVSVIAFGAAVRPLAEDELLTPMQVAKYIVLAMVPMLQFALPFAAGFGATMAFHRMASDNEMVAISVGGISYPRILTPALALGVVLSAGMVGLTQWVIPRFWGLIGETITSDVTEIFQNKISSGHPFTIGDIQIYAEDLVPQKNPPETGADDRLVLRGVAAAELDDEGRMVTDITASDAVVDIYRREEGTILKLVLSNTEVFKRETGELAHMEVVEPQAVVVPSPLRTDARAMSREALIRLRTEPERHAKIHELKLELVRAIFDYELWAELGERLRQEKHIELRDAGAPGVSYVIEARDVAKGQFVAARGERVIITQLERGRPVTRFACDRVSVRASGSGTISDATFKVELGGVEVTNPEDGSSRNFRERIDKSMRATERPDGDDLASQPVDSVLAKAQTLKGKDREVTRLLGELQTRLQRLQWEITSRLQKRYAMSATALLLIVLGSVLAIWLRHTQPLNIYLLSFMPSVLDLILISGGEQMIREGAIAGGAAVMWTGNAILLAVSALAFMQLRRH